MCRVLTAKPRAFARGLFDGPAQQARIKTVQS
jgi:hypothetical protein